MTINSVNDMAFAKYGKIIKGFDFTDIIGKLIDNTDKPESEVRYEPSLEILEKTPAYSFLKDNIYGGMPIQIGYCNGNNVTLNCLEYHRGSEVNIAADDVILLLASMQDVRDNKLNTEKVEAFLLPAGQAVLLYETSLHYAPCNGQNGDGFRVAIVLPLDTNTEKPSIDEATDEDKLLFAKNKWLIAHPDSPEAGRGAYIGLEGKNITV